jgi:lysyl endopeptidase
MRPFRLAAWATALCAIASAQSFSRKEPAVYAGTERASRVTARPPGIRLRLGKAREFALAPLSNSEAARLGQPDILLKVGVHRSVGSGAMNSGAWETTSEGGRVWRLALRSPGSQGLRVEFANFSVGNGKVWLYDGTQVAGPYTGRGVFDDGHFWSGSIFAESVTLEYEPEAGAPEAVKPPFEIRAVSHRATNSATRSVLQATPRTDPADYCHLDPNCYPDWKPTMSSVAQLLFEQDGLEYLCSGSAISTRDNSFKPYLLTAAHCIHREDAARSLETYWTYQTSSCGGTPPLTRDTSSKSTVGAHLLASGPLEDGDYSLVLLKDVPAGVTFAGWDTSDPAMGAPLTGIHHPVGSWKRISFGNRTTDQTVEVEGNLAPATNYMALLLSKGRIEPGSSGSPLFSSPGVIVGTLTYGPGSDTLSACEISPFVAGYGKFSNEYTHLRDYLENLPAAEVKPKQTDLQFTVADRHASDPQNVTLTTQSQGQLTYKLRADAPWIQLSTTTGTVSQSSPATVQISIDPSLFDKAGKYNSTVTILTGSADPQFVNVSADVRTTASNVQVSATPDTVISSSGLWQFTIKLVETGGASTHITGVKVNGTDYSSAIVNWLGADHLDANGEIDAPLTASGRFPPGDQYFEFFGLDDSSGQRWYRVVTVRFQ